MIAAMQPRNLLHVCFDNAAYASTGNQRTISAEVALEAIAAAAGYVAAARVETPTALEATFAEWLHGDGPRFLLARVEPESGERHLPRVEPDPILLAERFRGAARREC
jgi:phosphonopyruvate decarboxylase